MTTNFSNLKLSYKPGPILLTSHACSLWRVVVVVVSHARSQAPESVWSDSSTSDNQHTTLCRRLSLAGSGTNLRSYWWRRAALSRLVVSLQSESFLSNPLTLPDGCSCSATTCHTQSWKDYKFTMVSNFANLILPIYQIDPDLPFLSANSNILNLSSRRGNVSLSILAKPGRRLETRAGNCTALNTVNGSGNLGPDFIKIFSM